VRPAKAGAFSGRESRREFLDITDALQAMRQIDLRLVRDEKNHKLSALRTHQLPCDDLAASGATRTKKSRAAAVG
jgi:hypothetical protein